MADAKPRWITASAVRELPVDWLWSGWIPLGEVTLLESLPKVGKSTVLRDLAARVTRGAPMPRGGAVDAADVVWLSTEESNAKSLVPGLRIAGADLDRVTLRHHDADAWTVRDEAELVEVIESRSATLVVVDHLKDVTSVSAKEAEMDVRRAMRALGGIAQRTNAAIVAVRHWRKGEGPAATRGAGTIAYAAVAAGVIGLGEKDGRTGIARTMGRFGRTPCPIALNLVDGGGDLPRVEWGDDWPDFSIDEVSQSEVKPRARQSMRDKAKVEIRRELSDGPRPASEVKEEVSAAVGCGLRTVEDASAAAGVLAERNGFGGAVIWRLRDCETDANDGPDPDPPISQPGSERDYATAAAHGPSNTVPQSRSPGGEPA